MYNSFIIVVSIILIIQVLILGSFLRFCPVVKAGNVSKFCWKYKLLFGKVPDTLNCNGKIVNVSSYKDLYVEGNAMKVYKIYDGQQIFVSRFFSEKQKESITDFPVLVYHSYNTKYKSQYKLRKFVCYITNPKETDWEEIYCNFKSRIRIYKAEFISELHKKKEKLINPLERHILSETYDEDENKFQYSLHSVSSIYGKALYTF